MITNQRCTIQKAGEVNLYGQETAPGARHVEGCCVIKSKRATQHTTVRADSGGTRGHAEETILTNVVLLTPTTKATVGDRLDAVGVSMRITILEPQYDVAGQLDHYQAEGVLWA